MAQRFYDVIVLGADLGPLLCAAILAKRGFRVLVLGCGGLDDTYEEEDLRLPRWPFYFGVGDSPIVRRAFSDMGLWQIVKRKLEPLEPAYQVVLPRSRIDVARDPARYAEEIAREFPEARRAVEVFYGRLEQLNAGLDAFLADELPLPPDGFFERRRFLRASVQNPFGPYGDGADLWADLPEDHPFRLSVLAQVRCATHADPDAVTPLQVARLHGSWRAQGALPEGGGAGLRAFLRERIALHAGELAPAEGIAEIVMRRGRAIGVRRERTEELTGAQYVVAGVEAERLAGMFGDHGPPAALRDVVEECRPRYRRFTCNLVVRREAIPVGMARHVFFVPEPGYPPIEDNLLFLEVVPLDAARSVICAQAFAQADRVAADPRCLDDLQRRIVARLSWLFPFLQRHLLCVSSPWILPERLREAARVPPAERLARSPARMPGVSRLPHGSTLGLTVLSHRLAGRHLYLTGRDVVPGLGDEGVFLSAWTVARIITQKDPRRIRLRRELGSVIES